MDSVAIPTEKALEAQNLHLRAEILQLQLSALMREIYAQAGVSPEQYPTIDFAGRRLLPKS